MSTKKLRSVDNILDEIKIREDLDTDAKLADFLGVKPGTVSAWRSRESLDWPLILAKCSQYADDLLYTVEYTTDQNSGLLISEPVGDFDDPDTALAAYEQRIDGLVSFVEHGPFSRGLKVRLIETLLKMVGAELDELQTQSDPTQPVDDKS